MNIIKKSKKGMDMSPTAVVGGLILILIGLLLGFILIQSFGGKITETVGNIFNFR